MSLQSKKIREHLQFPVTVHVYDTIDSTNNEAKRRAQTDRGIHLYAADHQTAGRGRRGHDFYSPKGTGLYMTLSLPLSGTPADIQSVTCAAAVAVCEAVEALSNVHPMIKWVNDIYLNGKKAAGILAELVTDNQNRPIAVIIGIGLNLRTEHFPAAFAQRAGNIGAVDPNLLCAGIANRLTEAYQEPPNYSYLEKYKNRSLCIGRVVTYTDGDGMHTATAVDIAGDGGLIVEENGVRTVLNSGDISVMTDCSDTVKHV